MTTGTVTVGTLNATELYAQRYWNGGNGRATKNPYILNFTRETTKATTLCSNWYYYPNDYCTGPTYTYHCNVYADEAWSANDELALLGRLAEKIRGHGFNAATFTAQGGQAVDQAVNTLRAFSLSVRSLRHGDVSGAMRAIGLIPGQRSVKRIRRKLNTSDVSGAWLAMQYGWLPTLSDVAEAWNAYKALMDRERQTTFTAQLSRSANYNGSPSPPAYTCFNTVTKRKRYKYTLREQLLAARSLGLTDPASVAWEILPWSFVVDWFIPIGSYLEALNIFPSVSGSWVSSYKVSHHGTVSYYAPLQNGYRWVTGLPNPTSRRVHFERNVGVGSLSVPRPHFRSLPEAMRPNRIWNAIALAHQQFHLR